MKTSFWRRWCKSICELQNGGTPRGKPRKTVLCLEALEDRVTPSLTPQMVLDINTNTWSSNPSQLVAIGSTTYFVADDGIHGLELWKSDGTDTGTVLVKDINPGSAGAFYHNGYYTKDWLTNVNGTLFFSANDGSTTGYELWKSDGTAAGTTLVKDLTPGGAGSGPNYLTNVNGTLFFSAYDSPNGWELWKSDGTADGTMVVKDINPGYSGSNPRNLTNVNGTLFFSTWDYFGTIEPGLWKSNGTAAGTVLVKGLYAGGQGLLPQDFTNVNGTLFFRAYDVATSWELWKSDGTADGTGVVKDIIPGNGSSWPSQLTYVNGTLFFTANDGSGAELWKSDGTAAGTTLVKNIYPEPPGGYGGSNPSNLTNVNGTLFFTARDDTTYNGLWKSDGTAAGTALVKDLDPGSALFAYPGSFTNVNGTLFFTTQGEGLWKSDGTEAGTVLVKDIYPGSTSNPPFSLTNVNGTLTFVADDGRHGLELWKSDGTEAGTSLVKDINTKTFASYPGLLADIDGTLYFSANDGAHGAELWKSDGTVAGTTLVKDIFPGGYTGYYGGYYPNSSSLSNVTNVNGTLFFTVWSSGTGSQLWKSDGTEAGTVLVRSGSASNLTNVNGTLFFSAGGFDGVELWKSDGTAAGTTMVKDIYLGYHIGGPFGSSGFYPNSSYPAGLTNLNGTLYFSAVDETHGRELWKSDGTAAGTTLVKDIRPGSYGSGASPPTEINGTLFFRANDGTTGYELWKSDGTAAGTVLVNDIRPGSTGSYANSLTNVNGTLFFQANDGTTGYELWKSDGTAAGTALVKDIKPGSGNSYPADDFYGTGGRAVVNGTLFFHANDGVHGRELWKSDGTAAGTTLVKDIYPGIGKYTAPLNLTNVNGTLFFTANDGTGAQKLWQSDGTAAGTVLVANLAAGSLTNVNGTLFFTADDGTHGTELWMLAPADTSAPPTVSINDVTVAEGNTGVRTATFTVTLSAASDKTVTVSYATANVTATAGSDYQASSGTLTFLAGQTTGLIHVLVNGDRLAEPNETFFVNLISATNATIVDAQGVGAIVDDEPRLNINDVSKTESNSGATVFRFTVTLSSAYDETVTINFNTLDGTAKAGSDYQAQSGTLIFAPGETVKYIDVIVYGDTSNEADESFFVQLTGASSNVWVDDWVGEGWIVNDDTSPGRKGGKKK